TRSNIDRFTAIKGHFSSKFQESTKSQQGAFTPNTRPRHLIETYRALEDKNVKDDDDSSVTRNLARMKSQICINNNSEISTQTEDLLPFALKEKNFIVDENSNGHSSNNMEKSKVKPGLVDNGQDDECFFDAHNDVQSVNDKNGGSIFGTVKTEM
uniref:Uncharacterized protein n=1 Tax=Romanomermis culicivorax TaxID=13658 RepID=A0A915II86_ROMCU